jgi:hypothetical protein
MARPAQWAQHRISDFWPRFHERVEELLIRCLVPAKAFTRALHGVMQACCGSLVERMGQHDRRGYPVEAMLAQRKRLEKR